MHVDVGVFKDITSTDVKPTYPLLWLLLFQHVTSCPSAWQPSLGPHTARRPTQSNPSAMLWECPTSRPSGSIKCQTIGTRTMLAYTLTSPPSVEPSSTLCTSSNGEQSLWCMTTAQVQVQLVSVFIFCPVLCDDERGGVLKRRSLYAFDCPEKRRGTGRTTKSRTDSQSSVSAL